MVQIKKKHMKKVMTSILVYKMFLKHGYSFFFDYFGVIPKVFQVQGLITKRSTEIRVFLPLKTSMDRQGKTNPGRKLQLESVYHQTKTTWLKHRYSFEYNLLYYMAFHGSCQFKNKCNLNISLRLCPYGNVPRNQNDTKKISIVATR